jgi:hypothetical protein
MTVLFIIKQIKRLRKFILKTVKIIKYNLYYINKKRKMKRSASRGFELYKNNKNIDGKTAKNILRIIKKDSVKNQNSLKKSKKKI